MTTHDSEQLAVSYQYCRKVAADHAKSFYFSSFALPRHKRRAAYAVYAFCRHADDTIDVACEQNPAAKAGALAGLQQEFAAIMAGQTDLLPFAPAFAATIEQYQIPERYFTDLIHGVGMDVGAVKIKNWPELREYCYYVASVVGLIMARIFGLEAGDEEGEARAIDLGIAMQLTNIIRDVAEDYQRGRIYLPADEMAAAGLDDTALAATSTSPQLRQFIADQVERAREHYAASEAGIRKLDRDGSQLTVWTMRHVYAGILDEVEKVDYDMLSGRVATSLWRKFLLAWQAWQDSRKPA